MKKCPPRPSFWFKDSRFFFSPYFLCGNSEISRNDLVYQMICSLSLQAQFNSTHNLHFLLHNYPRLPSHKTPCGTNSKGSHSGCPSAMRGQLREPPGAGGTGKKHVGTHDSGAVVGQGSTERSPGLPFRHAAPLERLNPSSSASLGF